MNATPAECLVCPHPARNHDDTGCRPDVGMCACAIPASQLPKRPAPVDLELAPAAADAVAQKLADSQDPDKVCLECGHPNPHTVQRGQCPVCGCDGPRWGYPSELEDSDSTPDEPATDGGGADTAGQQEPAPVDFEAAPPEQPPARAPELGGSAPLDRRAGTARNYDWPALKRRYVEGIKGQGEEATVWPSLNEVAHHFGVTASRVREKAAQDGWAEQRKQWQAYMERTRQQARAAALAKSGVELDNRAIDASKAGLQLLYALLVDRTQQVQLARQGAGDAVGAVAGTLSALELQRIASAVDLFHKIGLRAVGDPEVTRLEITGTNGRPLEIGQELRRDDPDRMATVLAVLRQAGMGDIFGGVGGDVGGGPAALERAPDGSYPTEAAR